MAVDTRKLVIEIIDSSSGGESTQGKETKEESKTNLTKLLQPNQTKQTKDLAMNVLVNQAYGNAKAALIQSVEFNLNRYFTMHEDYMNENTYNNAKSYINKSKNAIVSIIAGFKIGGPIGAAVAGAGWLVNQGMAEKSTMSQYYQGLNSANMETSFNRTRAGLINNSKGTEN